MVLLKSLRETILTSCSPLAKCLTLIYLEHRPASLPFLNAWLLDLAKIGYCNPEPRRHKHFAYLTEEGVLTPSSNFPNSTSQQGRNVLLRLALAMEVSPGYAYFIFTDEDVKLENVDDPSHLWKQDMSNDPWFRLEVIKITINIERARKPKWLR